MTDYRTCDHEYERREDSGGPVARCVRCGLGYRLDDSDGYRPKTNEEIDAEIVSTDRARLEGVIIGALKRGNSVDVGDGHLAMMTPAGQDWSRYQAADGYVAVWRDRNQWHSRNHPTANGIAALVDRYWAAEEYRMQRESIG